MASTAAALQLRAKKSAEQISAQHATKVRFPLLNPYMGLVVGKNAVSISQVLISFSCNALGPLPITENPSSAFLRSLVKTCA